MRAEDAAGILEAADVYAIPGNHDWYDGLNSFMGLFCARRPLATASGQFGSGRRIGGRLSRQTRSYFALKLPGRWWLLAADSQLTGYIDRGQIAFFDDVAQTMMEPGSNIILCAGTPSWEYVGLDGGADELFRNHSFLEGVVTGSHRGAGARRHSLRLVLSGDSHHYARFLEGDNRENGPGRPDDPAPGRTLLCHLGRRRRLPAPDRPAPGRRLPMGVPCAAARDTQPWPAEGSTKLRDALCLPEPPAEPPPGPASSALRVGQPVVRRVDVRRRARRRMDAGGRRRFQGQTAPRVALRGAEHGRGAGLDGGPPAERALVLAGVSGARGGAHVLLGGPGSPAAVARRARAFHRASGRLPRRLLDRRSVRPDRGLVGAPRRHRGGRHGPRVVDDHGTLSLDLAGVLPPALERGVLGAKDQGLQGVSAPAL